MDRAYSLLTITKAVEDGEQRLVEGLATTPDTDRVGDIVDPEGAEFALPLPFLWQHDRTQPIGEVLSAKVTKDGIAIQARLADVREPGRLKERLDDAWQTLKAGLVKGLSIGFMPLEVLPIKGTYGLHIKRWSWFELSAVTVPANASASIATIKSLDESARAASGLAPAVITRPGAAGVRVIPTQKPTGSMKKPIADQIAALEATRAATAARLNELQDAAGVAGRTKDAAEREEFDTLRAELTGLDGELADLRALEAINKAAATPVAPAAAAAAARTTTGHITVTPNQPPGIGFARAQMCKAHAWLEVQNGRFVSTLDIAKQRYPDDQRLQAYLKAPVAPATTTNADWAGSLVNPTNIESEFIEYLQPRTIIGRLPATRVPFNVRINSQTSGGEAYWVGQGKPKPLTSFAFAPITVPYTKVATISVATEETIRLSTPSAETLIRDGIAKAVIRRIDLDLIDPAKAAVANVSPASLTNGVTPLTSSGITAEAARADLAALLGAYLANNQTVEGLVLIMPGTLALQLSLMRTEFGAPQFPGLTMNGGTMEGVTVITTQYAAMVPAAGNMVIAVNGPEVLLADDGQVTIDVSREASLEMSDAPAHTAAPAPQPMELVSMWQTNSVAFRAERWIHWVKARPTSVVYIDQVAWGTPVVTP